MQYGVCLATRRQYLNATMNNTLEKRSCFAHCYHDIIVLFQEICNQNQLLFIKSKVSSMVMLLNVNNQVMFFTER